MLYTNITDPHGSTISFNHLLQLYSSEYTKTITETARKFYGVDVQRYKSAKRNLHAYAFNAVTSDYTHRKDKVEKLTNLFYIDIDAKDNPAFTVHEIKRKLNKLFSNSILILQTSCSGHGVCCVIRYSIDADFDYSVLSLFEQFNFVFQHIDNQLLSEGLRIDSACSNITQLSFINYDPDFYANPQATFLQVPFTFADTTQNPHKPATTRLTGIDSKSSVNLLLEFESHLKRLKNPLRLKFNLWSDFGTAILNLWGEPGLNWFRWYSVFVDPVDTMIEQGIKENVIQRLKVKQYTHESSLSTIDYILSKFYDFHLSKFQSNKTTIEIQRHISENEENITQLIDLIDVHKKVQIEAATGTGKSTAIIKAIDVLKSKYKCCFLLPTIVSIQSIQNQYQRYAHNCIFTETNSNVQCETAYNSNVVITTLQSFVSKYNTFQFDYIFIDESHLLVSDYSSKYKLKQIRQFIDYTKAYTQTKLVYLSGTVSEAFVRLNQLKHIEYISSDPQTFNLRYYFYKDKELNSITNFINDTQTADNIVMCIVNRIKDCTLLKEQLIKLYGYTESEILICNTNYRENTKAIVNNNNFIPSGIKVVISTSILETAVDLLNTNITDVVLLDDMKQLDTQRVSQFAARARRVKSINVHISFKAKRFEIEDTNTSLLNEQIKAYKRDRFNHTKTDENINIENRIISINNNSNSFSDSSFDYLLSLHNSLRNYMNYCNYQTFIDTLIENDKRFVLAEQDSFLLSATNETDAEQIYTDLNEQIIEVQHLHISTFYTDAELYINAISKLVNNYSLFEIFNVRKLSINLCADTIIDLHNEKDKLKFSFYKDLISKLGSAGFTIDEIKSIISAYDVKTESVEAQGVKKIEMMLSKISRVVYMHLKRTKPSLINEIYSVQDITQFEVELMLLSQCVNLNVEYEKTALNAEIEAFFEGNLKELKKQFRHFNKHTKPATTKLTDFYLNSVKKQKRVGNQMKRLITFTGIKTLNDVSTIITEASNTPIDLSNYVSRVTAMYQVDPTDFQTLFDALPSS